MKVGQTTAEPSKRTKSHIGTAPEKPVIGFLVRTNHADLLERLLHIELIVRKQYMPDALGAEWFLTNPEELRDIAARKLEILAEEQDE